MTLARRRLASFASVTREDYVDSWALRRVLGPALDLVIRHARGFSDGIRRLVIEMPQQEGKTLFTSLTAASLLGQEPGFPIQTIGYGDEFVRQCTAYVSQIGDSDGWADVYPDVALGKPRADRRRDESVDQKATDTTHQIDTMIRTRRGWTRAGGSFRARSVKGPVGGRPGRAMIFEDPYKGWDGEAGALSPTWNKVLENFYGAVFRSRRQDMASCEILAFTPFTDDDIRMKIIDGWCRGGGPFLWLRLPSKQRPDRDVERAALLARRPAIEGLARFLRLDADALAEAVARGGPCRPYDTRPVGACLSPERRGQEFVDELYAEAQPRDRAALLELCPNADIVDRFPTHYWIPWDPNVDGARIEDMREVAIFVDPNGDETEAGSFCSMGAWGFRTRPSRGPGQFPHYAHRMAQRRERPGYTDFCDLLAKFIAEWPEARTVKIERTGHGRSLATDRTFASRPEVRRRTLDFVDPGEGSKSQRWNVISTPHRQGCLFLPAARSACGRVDPSWVHDRTDASAAEVTDGSAMGYQSEMKQAGRSAYNDRTDETAMAISYLDGDGRVDEMVDMLARYARAVG